VQQEGGNANLNLVWFPSLDVSVFRVAQLAPHPRLDALGTIDTCYPNVYTRSILMCQRVSRRINLHGREAN